MRESLDIAINFVIKHEGGYVNDPKDPGGETKFGISKRAYPNLNIKDLTIEQAKAIYKKDYWDRCNCDEIEYPLDIVVFDTAVNMGIQRALVLYQENKHWAEYLLARIAYYSKLRNNNPTTYGKFYAGWINRVISLFNMIKNKGG